MSSSQRSFNITTSLTNNKGNLSYTYQPFQNFVNEEENSLGEFRTNKLPFSLNHPVSIEPLYSYDGAVDLILTDDENKPRLINSRFKLSENELFEYVFRLGSIVENIYKENILSSLIELQKSTKSITKVYLSAVNNSGNLKVGNYTFYFKYADGDGNCTDIFAESGIVSCFMGADRYPKTINGGYRNQNSHKCVILKLENLDTSYHYLKVFYSRETGDIDLNGVSEYYELKDVIPFNSDLAKIKIDGDEETIQITLADINTKYFVIDKAKAIAQCQSRLFLGNIEMPSDDVQELTDIGLRFVPTLIANDSENLIGYTSTKDYSDTSDKSKKCEYYNTQNIYNRTGYWNEEIYRFGVVFIYDNGNLSQVYNTRGCKTLTTETNLEEIDFVEEDGKTRHYIDFNEYSYKINENSSYDLNSAGVCRIYDLNSATSKVYGIQFKLLNYDYVKTYLEKLNIIGFFFVRLKRMPTILAQAVVLNMSKQGNNPVVQIPLLPGNKYETFVDTKGNLTNNYANRLRTATETPNLIHYCICPEYNLNVPHYNELFSGAEYPSRVVGLTSWDSSDRHYYFTNLSTTLNRSYDTINVLGIPDNTKTMAIGSHKFNGICGLGEEAYRVGYVGKKTKVKYKKWDPLKSPQKFKESWTNMVRGIFGSYVGIDGASSCSFGDIINIYIPDYKTSSMDDYFDLRYQDNTSYFAISQRIGLSELTIDASENGYCDDMLCYRGDCYICNFTWRVNRNFQDSSTPTNDRIVDEWTMRKYYNNDEKHVEEFANINRSDVNAVQLGSWITVKVCCSRNISLRAVDQSYSDEKGLTGHHRSFYPFSKMSVGGDWKIPESNVENDGYGKTVGHRLNKHENHVKYSNADFTNRIIYSNVKLSKGGYTNAYRVFEAKNYEDYNMERGAIIKLIETNNNLVCVFEHGVSVIPVNQSEPITKDGTVFINANKVLPEKLTFKSGMYGSQWADSVIKTSTGRIYGVDTVAKKIWMMQSDGSFTIISDKVIGEFLNNNIPLKEHDTTVKIGYKNVKTHYNAAKGDVMFTFYCPNESDNSKSETTWNICYNDFSQQWVTFYSWEPLETANVNNVMYSVDRNYARMMQEYLTYLDSEFDATITQS